MALVHIGMPRTDRLDILHPQDVHVLLVDDEQLSRIVVGNLLRKCDYKVTVVESGAQALDILRRSLPGTFQLILTDVMMPEVDGLDILRYVRSNAQLADLPVIMMSANEQKDAVFQAIKGGAEEYLVKPVTKKEVQHIWQYVWKRLSAANIKREQSQTDLQALQGSSGATDDAAAALAAALPSAPSSLGSAQLCQRQRQQQELVQSMQQLHRQQEQIVLQPDPQGRPQQQQQQQRQQSVVMSQWLLRAKRVVNPKEASWLFCKVLLLLQRMAAAAGPAGLPAGLVRPSKLLLHSNGNVTAAAVTAAAADPQEELVYHSPEEAAAATAAGNAAAVVAAAAAAAEDATAVSPQDSFSLGVLLFDLMYAAPGGAAGRWKVLADLRQRAMPAAFLKQYPAEAAVVLALLHPDPAARPGLRQLLAGDLLSGYCEVLQERQKQQQGRDADSLVFFLQTLQGRKQLEVSEVQASVAELQGQVAAVEAALREVQQLQQEQQGQQLLGGVVGCGEIAAALVAASAAAVPSGSTGETAGGAAAAPAAVGRTDAEDMDEDDLEMEMREQGRHKRRRIAAAAVGPAAVSTALVTCSQPQLLHQQPQQQLLRMSSANSGVAAAGSDTAAAAAAVVATPDVAAKWEAVVDKFPVLEGVYMKSRQAWEKQQEQQQSPNQQEQQQVGQQGGQQGSADSPAAATAGVQQSPIPGGLGRVLPEFLQGFGDDLWAYSRYSSMALRGTVRAAADMLGGGSAMVCSAAFDRDDEFVATAGVSKRIRIFEYASITSSACGPGGYGCTTGSCAAPGLGGFSRGGGGFGGGLAGPSAGLSAAVGGGVGGGAGGGDGGIVYPVLELSSRSRLSCVVWSSYVKAHVASSDYEGVVQLWDANTGSELVQFEEHAKRAWAVDFSRLEPTRLVSSSDDGTVKLWSIHQESSVATLQLHANVCSVQFSPENPHLLAAGCANYRMYLYDLRQTAQPLACVPGHRKAVSYVRWLGGDQLVSASTDNTLKLWSVPALLTVGTAACGSSSSREAAAAVASACVTTYSGHANERNFIGLAVLPGTPGDALSGSSRLHSSSSDGGSSRGVGGYLVCGSETNEVFAYHTSVPVPITSHNFSAPAGGRRAGGLLQQQHQGYRGGGAGYGDLDTLAELTDSAGVQDNFVSCVAWNRKEGTIVAANSAGHIKVLELV